MKITKIFVGTFINFTMSPVLRPLAFVRTAASHQKQTWMPGCEGSVTDVFKTLISGFERDLKKEKEKKSFQKLIYKYGATTTKLIYL
jgi:hypothetical protein